MILTYTETAQNPKNAFNLYRKRSFHNKTLCNKTLLVKPHITAQQYQDEVKNNYMKGRDILPLFLL